MSDSSEPIRKAVLELFERHRAVRGAPFEDETFLCYLLPKPNFPSNSFAGLRRFNRFIDAVQLKYSVCFSLKDREANYSLDRFVSRIVDLRRSKRSSLASLRNQERHGFGWQVVVVFNFLAALLCIFAFRHMPSAGWLLLMLIAVANAFVTRFYFQQRKYMKHLRNQIESAVEQDAA
jgi:hypothetical protein